jgi:hypothetical protein
MLIARWNRVRDASYHGFKPHVALGWDVLSPRGNQPEAQRGVSYRNAK